MCAYIPFKQASPCARSPMEKLKILKRTKTNRVDQERSPAFHRLSLLCCAMHMFHLSQSEEEDDSWKGMKKEMETETTMKIQCTLT